MTTLASTPSPASFGFFRACCARSEPAPPWLLVSSALILGASSKPGASAFEVLALLLIALMSWGAGWGAASPALELSFAGGWIAAWSGTATVLLATPGLLGGDARAWGAGLAAVLGIGLLAFAGWRRSLLTVSEPASGSQRADAKTGLLVVGICLLTWLVLLPGGGGPDWIAMGTALALFGILAKRGRIAPGELAP